MSSFMHHGFLAVLVSLLVVGLAIAFREPALGAVPLVGLVVMLTAWIGIKVMYAAMIVCLLVSIAMIFVSEGALRHSAVVLVAFFAGALCAGEYLTGPVSGRGAPIKRAGSKDQRKDLKPVCQIHSADVPAADFAASRAFWTGVTQVMSLRVRQPDGSYQWSTVRSEPSIPPSVSIDELNTSTEQRELVDADLLNEDTGPVVEDAKTIERLFGNGWAFDARGNWIYLPGFAQMTLGVTLELLNESRLEEAGAWSSLLHPDDYQEVAKLWSHSLRTGEPFNAEFRIKRKTGFAWARTSARCRRNRDGDITGWYGTSLDIDLQRKTIDALQERERELQQLVNAVPSNIWRLGPDGEPNFFNDRTIEFLGLDIHALQGRGIERLEGVFKQIVHPEDQGYLLPLLKQSLITGDAFVSKYRLRRRDGIYRWMSTKASPVRDRDGRIVQWYGVSYDIDDQVRAEEALQRSEWHLQRIIEALPVHVCSWTPDGTLSYVNKRYLDDLGIADASFSELVELAQSRIHPDDAHVVAETKQLLQCGEPFSIRYRRQTRNGSYRWADGKFEPLKGEDGAILEWYALTIDVDDEMKVQRSLRERERSLEQLVESLPTLIYCSTPEGNPIYRSQKLREFLGFNIDDKDNLGSTRLDGTLETIIHPDDLSAVRERYGQSLSTGTPYVLKHRLRRADGTFRWVETRAAPMVSDDGSISQWNGVCTDIDDLIRAQEELVLAQRNLARASQAASLAELTASIAHEVGQPLAALLSSSDACQQWLSTDPPNLERAQMALERVVRSATTATAVVTRIRALFKQTTDARVEVAIDTVVSAARDLTAEEATRRRMRIQSRVETNLPLLIIDKIQIQQVLVNLVRNAMDAMEGNSSDRIVQVWVHKLSDVLQVEIRDQGPGIQNMEQIFDPFFTTKGEGMGMGLAICRTIVEAHGGRLWAENNEGRGATFFFALPLRDDNLVV
ncbi:MAG: PAS domain-containing protein [Pseudorhizobium pelagicum]|uniref:PAS domain-containing sensor histidine kinase n=1 Tax=Pseudorhizobium pelagicum TaxID=1509405 RepID=UPI003461288D